MSCNDIELADGNKFTNQTAYEVYRDAKLAERENWKFNELFVKGREVIAIYIYEMKRQGLTFTAEDFNEMKKGGVKEIMENKIKAAK